MKIELKKVEYSPRLSEETNAFHAEVWIDGKKEGTAENKGTGGQTNVLPHTLKEKLDFYGSTLPIKHENASGYEFDRKQDAESLVNDAFNVWLIGRELKRRFASRILFTVTDQPGIFQTKKLTTVQRHALLTAVSFRERNKVKQILNNLPFDEAVRLYVAEGSPSQG